jgi:hypothetical protein
MNIKEVWNVWRESTPADKDMQRAFERACTPRACHGVLIELESSNQKIADLRVILVNIRNLLNEQKDKSCLGTGYPVNRNVCAPWPIVDEVINNISQALKEPKT